MPGEKDPGLPLILLVVTAVMAGYGGLLIALGWITAGQLPALLVVFVAPFALGVGVPAGAYRLAQWVARAHQRRLEAHLSMKYGVTARALGLGVWEIDGQMREAAVLPGRVLHVAGRELPRAADQQESRRMTL